MIHGKIVGEAYYKVIDMMKLPMEILDECGNDCPGNDKAVIINPEYKPKLKQWLIENNYNEKDCYIAWWCW